MSPSAWLLLRQRTSHSLVPRAWKGPRLLTSAAGSASRGRAQASLATSGQPSDEASTKKSAGLHQTPIVQELWKRRTEARLRGQELINSGVFENRAPERVLVEKTPEESSASITYNFGEPDMEWLKDKYRNPWGQLRFGRLLEDLDALAGTIAFEHVRCEDPRVADLHMVTASVDRIRYARRPGLHHNVRLAGSVTWVGRSSLEILMKAFTDDCDLPFLESYFTFVARDPETGRPARVNSLRVDGSEQKLLFHIGRQRDLSRKLQRKAAKRGHNVFDEDVEKKAREFHDFARPYIAMPALVKQTAVLVSETQLQNTFTTVPQNRNLAGTVFGGFLMRRAFELAHATAYLYAGRRPVFHEVSEITFLTPVNMGDNLQFQSRVLYTSDEMDVAGRVTMHLEVVAMVLKPETQELVTSNVFNFTFGAAQHADGSGGSALKGTLKLRKVLPESMEMARRMAVRYFKDKEQLEEDQLTGWRPLE